MKKILVITLLIYSFFCIYGQTIGDVYDNYKIGIDYLQKGNYQMADSFITKYLNSGNPFIFVSSPLFGYSAPINYVYFNRAIAKLGLKDTATACSDFHDASIFNDEGAFRYYCEICTQSVDSIYYNKKYNLSSKDKSRYLVLRYYDKYNNKLLGRILDLNTKDNNPQKISIATVNNIIGLFYINNQDTIYSGLFGNYLPKFKKWNNDYYSFIDSKIRYPEDKTTAYKLYNENNIYVNYKVIIDKNGKIEKINLFKSFPDTIDKKYVDEALRVINIASDYIVPGNMFGKNVKSELIFPVVFKLKE